MFCEVLSAGISGISAYCVTVECDVSGGLPAFNMVGLLSSEVREAKERVMRAITNSGFDLPPRKITVNLSPANIKKQGSGFDVPIAIGILMTLGLVREDAVKGRMFIGELSLDGKINRVNGVLPITIMAAEKGIKELIAPKVNVFEGKAEERVEVYGASTLKELVEELNKGIKSSDDHINLKEILCDPGMKPEADFNEVSGQVKAKRATMIAASGFHNLLYIGPPGSGKSMMAKRIPSILDPMTPEECLEVSAIYSVMGLLKQDTLNLTRPYRAPHHSISGAALYGSARNMTPGEMTLAHRGVLFLDEIGEFNRDVIERLREPLENKQVTITGTNGSVTLPADFMLVCATNPCKCGYYPDRRFCKCSEAEVTKYIGQIKGPILDRIDICVSVNKVEIDELYNKDKNISSAEMRKKVSSARKMQEERFKGLQINFNSQMNKKETDRFCQLSPKDKGLLDRAYEKYNLSARGYVKILKTARTIADLEGTDEIKSEHVLEAIGYRNSYLSGGTHD